MHDSIGTPWAHRVYYLPNGRASWRPSYSEVTYTLVQNPNPAPVHIQVKYLKPDGVDNVTFTDTIGASSRKTYCLNDRVGAGGEASIEVMSTDPGLNIIAECAFYYSAGFGQAGGTCTIGGWSD